MVAGALGIGAEYLANLCGESGEPVILAISVFVLATTATFTRFYPSVKRRCDYGVMIFILTFALVAVSGSRVTEILQLAHQRLSTILIGGAICMMISVFVRPVWAGQDLHDQVATDIENLASYLEGFVGQYFDFPGNNDEKPYLLHSYESILDSKATKESLANFAWWEPRHAGFRFNHPWKQYLKIGALASECACHIKALDGYAVKSKVKSVSKICKELQNPCITMSSDSAKALKDLASAIKTLKFPTSDIQTHIQNSKSGVDEFEYNLKNMPPPQQDIQEIMQLLVAASILIHIIKCVEELLESILELSEKAGFEKQTSNWDIHDSC
ncbi:aluminum-activated malate transporter 8-like [Dorcoceras hygrometricum]|uniref:Aluminum-activated malate transporter 8-like n=1 Tax=Dorcoceras hygrometricum TaxID=472368 RepID=A0A2Z7A713_9LAMI|nr:aluminum-activated malate transporter 8-like [Dorcoceras hygrometricum]